MKHIPVLLAKMPLIDKHLTLVYTFVRFTAYKGVRIMTIKENAAGKAKSLKILEVIGVTLFLIAVIAAELYRLVHWDFTWDESITYTQFIKPVFYGEKKSLIQAVKLYFSLFDCWCAMNNHILNTLSMGISAKLFFRFFGYGNEVVLRLPVIACFCLYLTGVIYLYAKKRITWIGVVLLCGSRFAMDFFAISRGYAMAATFIFLACICLEEWERTPQKEWLVVLCIFCVTLGIVAQTVTLIIAAAIYLWLLIRILQRRILMNFFKPSRLAAILPMVAVNAAMVVFHMVVSNADHCLAPDGSTNMRSVILNTFCGCISSNSNYLPALLFFMLLEACWILFLCKKTQWTQMVYVFIFTVYLIPMAVITNTVRMGLPIARTLLPAFPVLALAIHSSIIQFSQLLPSWAKKFPAILCLLAVLSLWRVQGNLNASIAWPNDQGIKAQCFKALEDGTKLVLSKDDSIRSESFTFYQDKIFTVTKYDIIYKD